MIKHLALAIVLGGGCLLSSAQNYYDDDIYYNATKEKKQKEEAAKKAAEQKAAANYVANRSVDFPSSDTYTVNSGSTRDVDEYNRRYGTSKSVSGPSADDNTFANTRKIERYHNPDIVEGSGDETLQYLYYTNEAERQQKEDVTQINIYVNNPWGWDSWWPYYNSYAWGPSWSWGWNSWYWNSWYWPSWYSWNWGPSWSWGWNWGPSWSWGWNWGGPAWGGGPVWGAPVRPGGGWNRPGNPAWNRPGNMAPSAPGRGNFVRHNNAPAKQQPGFNSSTLRHGTILRNNANNAQTGVSSTRRIGNFSRPGTGTTQRTPAVRQSNTNSSRYSTPNNSSSSSRHNSTGSFNSSGSRSTGVSTGGGSRNTGGGSGRGRH